MHILVLVDCYFPSRKSGAKHIHDLSVELQRQGHQITILTPTDLISKNLEVSDEEGLQIVRIKTGRIKGTSKALRAVREARLSSILWRRGRRFLVDNPCDLIIYYSPTIFFSSLVRRLKSLWRCSSYLILRDIFPQWAVDAGVLKKGLIWSFFRSQEVAQYDAADIIAVQSHGDLKYFQRNFPEKNYQLQVLYNWASLLERNVPTTHYRADLGLTDKVVFLYGGNLGVAQDADNIVRLAASVSSFPHVHFLIVGEGTEVPRVKGAVSTRGLHNVQFLPPVGQFEYLAMVSEFDVGLLSLDRRLTTHNIPGKLFGYMYSNKPVLASLNPGNDLFALIDQYQAGFCLVNGDDGNLSAAALRLANEANLRFRMGQNARHLLESVFSVEVAAGSVLDHISKPNRDDKQVKSVLAPSL